MLKMKPSCECCDVDLHASKGGAMICSFECTFCADCATHRLAGKCPNCGGELVSRPRRAEGLLVAYPASTERTTRAQPCPA